MTEGEVRTLTRGLMNDHGVGYLGFEFTESWDVLGSCIFDDDGPVRIELSLPLVSVLPEVQIRDTILHEIAHALAGEDAGHGKRWQRTASLVGADPRRVTKFPPEIHALHAKAYRYKAVCPNHGAVQYLDKLTKAFVTGKRACVQCKSVVTVESNDSHALKP